MARKLSSIAPQIVCVPLAALGLSALATAFGEEQLNVTSPSAVVENPYAAGKPQLTVPDEPEEPSAATTYHNPFATTRPSTMQLAPPVAPPRRPGPISRWQRTNSLSQEPSSVRTAILDLSAVPHDPFSIKPPNSPDAPGLHHFGQPPDPIDFGPRPLMQPAWLAIDNDQAEPLLRIGITPPAQPVNLDTFQVRESPLDASTVDQHDDGSSSTTGASGLATPTSPDWLPVIVSDFVDSPESCYLEARQTADVAETVDQLTTVIDLCHRGLGGNATEEAALPLRRLAAWAYNRRGELRCDTREQDDAFSDFQAAVALDPGCWAAIHNRGITLAEQGQQPAALRDLNRVLELNPSLTVAYRNRAELLASIGRMREAVRDYTQALEQTPDDAELYRARSYAWQRLGDYDRALLDLNVSLQLFPDQADTYTQRGHLSAEQGRFSDAVANYRQALEIDSNWAEGHRSLAWLWSTCPNPEFRRVDGALASARQAMALASADDSVILDTAAAAHANAGQFDEAVQLQRQAIEKAPADTVESMRQRLTLYQQQQPFRTNSLPPAVTAASHSEPSDELQSQQR